ATAPDAARHHADQSAEQCADDADQHTADEYADQCAADRPHHQCGAEHRDADQSEESADDAEQHADEYADQRTSDRPDHQRGAQHHGHARPAAAAALVVRVTAGERAGDAVDVHDSPGRSDHRAPADAAGRAAVHQSDTAASGAGDGEPDAAAARDQPGAATA